MPSQPPIPSLLSPYVSVAPSVSLTLLTSTLGATTSWLILRIIYAALNSGEPRYRQDANPVSGIVVETGVVMVSWLGDEIWWKEGGRKLGINLRKVYIVDGLSSGLGLGGGGIVDVETTILKAIESAKEAVKGRVLLVLDGLDFLLAATGCGVLEELALLGELREHVHSTIVTTAADLPHSPSPTTPLEVSHTAFMMSLAHQARVIMSLRGLDTGFARDVSGVLRISRGAAEPGNGAELEERECLYHVAQDGGVKVFDRGA